MNADDAAALVVTVALAVVAVTSWLSYRRSPRGRYRRAVRLLARSGTFVPKGPERVHGQIVMRDYARRLDPGHLVFSLIRNAAPYLTIYTNALTPELRTSLDDILRPLGGIKGIKFYPFPRA
jgi:hypothetical protein